MKSKKIKSLLSSLSVIGVVVGPLVALTSCDHNATKTDTIKSMTGQTELIGEISYPLQSEEYKAFDENGEQIPENKITWSLTGDGIDLFEINNGVITTIDMRVIMPDDEGVYDVFVSAQYGTEEVDTYPVQITIQPLKEVKDLTINGPSEIVVEYSDNTPFPDVKYIASDSSNPSFILNNIRLNWEIIDPTGKDAGFSIKENGILTFIGPIDESSSVEALQIKASLKDDPSVSQKVSVNVKFEAEVSDYEISGNDSINITPRDDFPPTVFTFNKIQWDETRVPLSNEEINWKITEDISGKMEISSEGIVTSSEKNHDSFSFNVVASLKDDPSIMQSKTIHINVDNSNNIIFTDGEFANGFNTDEPEEAPTPFTFSLVLEDDTVKAGDIYLEDFSIAGMDVSDREYCGFVSDSKMISEMIDYPNEGDITSESSFRSGSNITQTSAGVFSITIPQKHGIDFVCELKGLPKVASSAPYFIGATNPINPGTTMCKFRITLNINGEHVVLKTEEGVAVPLVTFN